MSLRVIITRQVRFLAQDPDTRILSYIMGPAAMWGEHWEGRDSWSTVGKSLVLIINIFTSLQTHWDIF